MQIRTRIQCIFSAFNFTEIFLQILKMQFIPGSVQVCCFWSWMWATLSVLWVQNVLKVHANKFQSFCDEVQLSCQLIASKRKENEVSDRGTRVNANAMCSGALFTHLIIARSALRVPPISDRGWIKSTNRGTALSFIAPPQAHRGKTESFCSICDILNEQSINMRVFSFATL